MYYETARQQSHEEGNQKIGARKRWRRTLRVLSGRPLCCHRAGCLRRETDIQVHAYRCPTRVAPGGVERVAQGYEIPIAAVREALALAAKAFEQKAQTLVERV